MELELYAYIIPMCDKNRKLQFYERAIKSELNLKVKYVLVPILPILSNIGNHGSNRSRDMVPN